MAEAPSTSYPACNTDVSASPGGPMQRSPSQAGMQALARAQKSRSQRTGIKRQEERPSRTPQSSPEGKSDRSWPAAGTAEPSAPDSEPGETMTPEPQPEPPALSSADAAVGDPEVATGQMASCENARGSSPQSEARRGAEPEQPVAEVRPDVPRSPRRRNVLIQERVRPGGAGAGLQSAKESEAERQRRAAKDAAEAAVLAETAERARAGRSSGSETSTREKPQKVPEQRRALREAATAATDSAAREENAQTTAAVGKRSAAAGTARPEATPSPAVHKSDAPRKRTNVLMQERQRREADDLASKEAAVKEAERAAAALSKEKEKARVALEKQKAEKLRFAELESQVDGMSPEGLAKCIKRYGELMDGNGVARVEARTAAFVSAERRQFKRWSLFVQADVRDKGLLNAPQCAPRDSSSARSRQPWPPLATLAPDRRAHPRP